MAAVWWTGTLVLLGRVVVGLAGVERLRRRARARGRPYGSEQRDGVRVWVTNAVDVPMTVGLIRPVVLLPASEQWTEEERGAALAHELAHVRRGDTWTLLLGAIVRALHWPNPLVWIAVRRLRAVSEEACDAAVLAAGVPCVVYAQLLVRLAREAASVRSPRLAVTLVRSADLSRRVEAILAGSRRAPSRGGGALLVGLLAAAIACVAVVQPVSPTARAARGYAAHYGISEALAGRILRAAVAERIDPDLAFALVSVESDFDAGRMSRRGAVGLTQLLPTTAAKLQPGITPDVLRDPDTNLRLGLRLLRRYLEHFHGDRERALLAYNIGPANVRDAYAARRSNYPHRVLRAAAGSGGGKR